MRIKQEESEIQSIRFRTTQAARSMLSVLNRKMLTLVSHCADMLELCFDDADAVNDTPYILHVQSSFAIWDEQTVLFENRDFYTMQSGENDSGARQPFAEKLASLNQKLNGCRVAKAVVDRDCLCIGLDNGVQIEIDTDEEEENDEAWRFFKLDDISPHLIAYRHRFEWIH